MSLIRYASLPCPVATGAAVRARRQELGLTLLELSKRTGILESELSRLENGLMAKRFQNKAKILEKVFDSYEQIDI